MTIILVVDDNEDITYGIKMALKELDLSFDIIEANSGKECLSLLESKKPNLIVLDVLMPDINGWELGYQIKQNPDFKDIPILFLTGLDDPKYKQFALNLGVDYIIKPFDADLLYKKIKKVLGKK
jgi:CheY-like chemotaxis protein